MIYVNLSWIAMINYISMLYIVLLFFTLPMKKIVSDQFAPVVWPYSHGVVSNGLLFCSGQIALDGEWQMVGDDIVGEMHQVCKNIWLILNGAWVWFDQVIKCTVLLADIADYAAMNEVYTEYFTSHPARAAFAVKELPKWARVEIETIAEVA